MKQYVGIPVSGVGFQMLTLVNKSIGLCIFIYLFCFPPLSSKQLWGQKNDSHISGISGKRNILILIVTQPDLNLIRMLLSVYSHPRKWKHISPYIHWELRATVYFFM